MTAPLSSYSGALEIARFSKNGLNRDDFYWANRRKHCLPCHLKALITKKHNRIQAMESLTGYEPRTYRNFDGSDGFKTFRVVVETSDLYVKALCPLQKETEALIKKYRAQIQWAIHGDPNS